MIINNKSGCIVNDKQLSKAITWYKTCLGTKRFSKTITIFLSNSYPVISIRARNVPLSAILLSYIQQAIVDSKVYHVDGNNLNCQMGNLSMIPNKSIPVLAYNYKGEQIGEYPSVAEASRQTEISEQIIHSQIQGKTKKRIKVRCPEDYDGDNRRRFRNIRYPIAFKKGYDPNLPPPAPVGACPKGHRIISKNKKGYYCSECCEHYLS